MSAPPLPGFTHFGVRLPTRQDANSKAMVRLMEQDGSTRVGIWDWIPPRHVDAVELWQVNGFVAWAPIAAEEKA